MVTENLNKKDYLFTYVIARKIENAIIKKSTTFWRKIPNCISTSNIFTDNFVLDGKGHTIDGGNARQIFEIWGVQNVTLKNINFVNANTPLTIYYYPGEPINIINCSVSCRYFFKTKNCY